MLDLFNIPTPQTANYQEFFVGSSVTSGRQSATWNKPRGCSMVRIMLIGAGGGGGVGSSTGGAGGGGSGAVTSWIGPAIFVPDVLLLGVPLGGLNAKGGDCRVVYSSRTADNVLLTAVGGAVGTQPGAGNGGTAMTANQFTACGIFTSVAGQVGAVGSAAGAGSNIGVSGTTFLSGGAGGSGASGSAGGRVTPNYDYVRLENTPAGGSVAGANGYFITQPILVGTGGAGGATSTSVGSAGGRGGLGCGGGGAGEDATTGGGRGGDGAVFIWAW
jgi:hypothetical protein